MGISNNLKLSILLILLVPILYCFALIINNNDVLAAQSIPMIEIDEVDSLH